MDIIRVVIADDHILVRDGLRRILDRAKNISVVSEAVDGLDAIRQVEETSPNILILDIEMPCMNGYQVVEYFRSHPNPVKILVLSDYDVLDIAITMLNEGISGYLTKEYAPDYLRDAIVHIASGKKDWLTPQMRQKIAVWKDSLYGRIYLKTQQMQVLFLLIKGKAKQHIAEELGINEQMVANHILALQKMFGAKSEKDLIRIANHPAAGKVQVYPFQRIELERAKVKDGNL